MALETGTYISDLTASNPAQGDDTGQGDDHIRLIKGVLKASFPNVDGAVTGTPAQLNAAAAATFPIGNDDLADGGIPSSKFAAGAVDTAALADDAVTSAKIAAGAADTAALADDAVTSAKIAAGAADTNALADNGVTYGKLQQVTAAKLLGNPTSETANAEEIGIDSGLEFSGTSLKVKALPISSVSNLLIKNNAASPNTKIDVTADAAVLMDADGNPKTHTAISLTIDSTATGVNGCDIGTRSSSKSYDVYLISNGTTIAGLLVIEGDTPTMPSGYTFKKLVSWQHTDSSSNFVKLLQRNERVKYTGAPPLLFSGIVSDSITTDTTPFTDWQTYSLADIISASAAIVCVQLLNDGGGRLAVAPNNQYGGTQSTTLPPVLFLTPSTSPTGVSLLGEVELESTSIYGACSTSGSGRCFIKGFSFAF